MDRRIIMLIGVIALLPGAFTLLTQVVVDSHPPDRSASIPEDGKTYSTLSKVSITLSDATTHVASVSYQDSTSASISLTLTSGTEESGTWTADHPSPPTPGETTRFTFTYTDAAGNKGTYTGSYTIYAPLQGKWYINDQLITDSSTIITSSPTVTFKFTKTAGVADSKITCTMTITSGGTGSINLPNIASGVWEATYTFPKDGTYTVELKATDGVGAPIIASIIQVGTPSTTPPYLTIASIGIGATIILYGATRKP